MSIFQYIGLAFLAMMVLLASFIGYIRYELNQLEEHFRKNLYIGQDVVVDDGQQVFTAQVIGKGPGYVRIMTPEGTTAAYGLRCIYPVRE